MLTTFFREHPLHAKLMGRDANPHQVWADACPFSSGLP